MLIVFTLSYTLLNGCNSMDKCGLCSLPTDASKVFSSWLVLNVAMINQIKGDESFFMDHHAKRS